MSYGMIRELVYLSSYATNRYFIPNWGIIIRATQIVLSSVQIYCTIIIIFTTFFSFTILITIKASTKNKKFLSINSLYITIFIKPRNKKCATFHIIQN